MNQASSVTNLSLMACRTKRQSFWAMGVSTAIENHHCHPHPLVEVEHKLMTL
ncbi:hypothetical protein Scep_003762 [Stephania cephalantha]|uniref:Uncharacterized protein n=1 Tax=Stephania cephalantha TaxID=152367 RepID=A0AAP0KSM1_9MAGN